MYSLYIDTHDKNVIIVLYKNGKVLDLKNVTSVNKHSVVLMPLIKGIIESNKLVVNDLKEIIVVNGPGSFTGERLGVTIAKTMAYCLGIPIRVIDSLSVMAINIEDDKKYVALEDNNGAFLGFFDKDNKILEDFVYVAKNAYNEFKKANKIYTNVEIDYDRVYEFVSKKSSINPHEVKPLYVKGISALNDK